MHSSGVEYIEVNLNDFYKIAKDMVPRGEPLSENRYKVLLSIVHLSVFRVNQ